MVLKKLRHRKTAKKIWIILAILILPAFILWGSGSVMRSRDESTHAGIIAGRKVTLTDYRDAAAAVRNEAIMRFGDNIPEIEKYINLQEQTWIRLVLLAEAKKRRINASDKEVVETIQGYPFFQRQGQFDQRLYSQLLQYVFHVLPRAFEEQTRQTIILSKLYDKVTSGIKVTDGEIRKEYEKTNEELSVYYIASIPSDFIKDLNPEEAQLKDYFAKNSLNFKQPLSFNVEYVPVDPQGMDENRLKETIRKIFSRLSKKVKLSEAAAESGLQVKETGLFPENGPVPGIGWAPQITSRLSKAKAGDYMPLIQMDKYYYILKVKEIREPYIPDFTSIKDNIKEAFIKDKSREIARSKIEECLKMLDEQSKINPKSADLERAAREYGLKSGVTGMFKYASYIEGIGGSDIFWLKASELKEGQYSGVISTPTGFYIIKLKSKTPIDEQKFTQEKAAFGRSLLLQKKSEYFAKFVDKLQKESRPLF